MARDGLLPEAICRGHVRWRTRANAVVLQCGWTVVLIVAAFAWQEDPGKAFNVLTEFVIFGGSIFYAMAVGAVYVLRRTRPDAPRPYRTWGYPVTPALYLLAFSAALVTLLWQAPLQSLAGALLVPA